MSVVGFVFAGIGFAFVGFVGGFLTGWRGGRRCAETELAIALNEAIEQLRTRAAEQALEKAGISHTLGEDHMAELEEDPEEETPEAND